MPQVLELLTQAVLPAMSLLPGNAGALPAGLMGHVWHGVLPLQLGLCTHGLMTAAPRPAICTSAGLVYEIWRALEQLPYTDRFCIYADALKVGCQLRSAGSCLQCSV